MKFDIKAYLGEKRKLVDGELDRLLNEIQRLRDQDVLPRRDEIE